MREATIDTGSSFMRSSGGLWAGMQFMAAARRGEVPSPSQLRTTELLRKDEWKVMDTALVQAFQERIRAVADVIAAGLVYSIPNGLGKTILEWEKVGDLGDADVSLDGVTRTENDRVEFTQDAVPLPITHKDWYLNLRTITAGRLRGEPIDTTYSRLAGRRVAIKTEDMLINGLSKKFLGMTIYGYTNFPSRNIVSFGTGGAWENPAKTGEQVLADVMMMVAAAEADLQFGPYILYIGGSVASLKLNEDFKAASDKSIRQRILELEQISSIRTLDRLAPGNVLLIQMTSDNVELVEGERLQTIQWDIHGGMQINFKAFQILVPRLRTDTDGRSGIVHMS